MKRRHGKSYIDCYHPDMDDEWCSILVSWTYVYSQSTLEQPAEESYKITEQKLITSNGEYMPRDTEIPDWVTQDMLWDGIDLGDFEDGDDN